MRVIVMFKTNKKKMEKIGVIDAQKRKQLDDLDVFWGYLNQTV